MQFGIPFSIHRGLTMVLLRRSTQWASLLRHHSAKSIRSSIGSRTWQQSLRRGYASEGGHGAQQASSDLPWYAYLIIHSVLRTYDLYPIVILTFNANLVLCTRLVGAIVVTVPSTYYILKPNPNKDHGHGHGEGGHEEHEEHEESEEHVEAEAEEKTGEEAEDKQDGDGGNTEPSEGEGETSEDSESDDGAAQDTPETSDDDEPKNVAHETEGGGNVEGVQFKGATKGGEQGDTRKHIPDAKGFNKKRIESHYGNRLGAADEESEEDIDTVWTHVNHHPCG